VSPKFTIQTTFETHYGTLRLKVSETMNAESSRTSEGRPCFMRGAFCNAAGSETNLRPVFSGYEPRTFNLVFPITHAWRPFTLRRINTELLLFTLWE